MKSLWVSTVGWTEEAIWRCYFGLWEILENIPWHLINWTIQWKPKARLINKNLTISRRSDENTERMRSCQREDSAVESGMKMPLCRNAAVGFLPVISRPYHYGVSRSEEKQRAAAGLTRCWVLLQARGSWLVAVGAAVAEVPPGGFFFFFWTDSMR